MATSYPSGLDTLTNPAGTSLLTSPDHAGQHSNANDAIEAIESTLGTTAGTAVLRNFTSGNFAARVNSSNVFQHTLQGTLNNSIIGTPSLTGGTLNPSMYQIGGLSMNNILQFTYSSFGSVGTTSVDTELFCGEGTITPKSASSTLVFMMTVNGIRAGTAGRLEMYIRHSTSSGGTEGTLLATMQVLQSTNSTITFNTSSVSFVGTLSSTSTSQRFIKLIGVKRDNSTSWFTTGADTNSGLFIAELI